MVCLTEIKVRGYHADFYGHVNNARFLEFFEEDRWAFFESRMDLRKRMSEGLVFLVVNININYRKAVAVGSVLQVSTDLEHVGNKSGVLGQKIVFKDTDMVAADARVTFVFSDKKGKVVPLTGDLRKDLESRGVPFGVNDPGSSP